MTFQNTLMLSPSFCCHMKPVERCAQEFKNIRIFLPESSWILFSSYYHNLWHLALVLGVFEQPSHTGGGCELRILCVSLIPLIKKYSLWRAKLCRGDSDTCLALLSCWGEGDWSVGNCSDWLLESGSSLATGKKGSKTDAGCYSRNFMERGSSVFQKIEFPKGGVLRELFFLPVISESSMHAGPLWKRVTGNVCHGA